MNTNLLAVVTIITYSILLSIVSLDVAYIGLVLPILLFPNDDMWMEFFDSPTLPEAFFHFDAVEPFK